MKLLEVMGGAIDEQRRGTGQGRQRAAGDEQGQVGGSDQRLGPAGEAESSGVDDDVLAVAVEGAQLLGERFPQGQQAGGLLMGPDAG